MYVRVPISAINEPKAQSAYEEGMALGRGLLMSTLAKWDPLRVVISGIPSGKKAYRKEFGLTMEA